MWKQEADKKVSLCFLSFKILDSQKVTELHTNEIVERETSKKRARLLSIPSSLPSRKRFSELRGLGEVEEDNKDVDIGRSWEGSPVPVSGQECLQSQTETDEASVSSTDHLGPAWCRNCTMVGFTPNRNNAGNTGWKGHMIRKGMSSW